MREPSSFHFYSAESGKGGTMERPMAIRRRQRSGWEVATFIGTLAIMLIAGFSVEHGRYLWAIVAAGVGPLCLEAEYLIKRRIEDSWSFAVFFIIVGGVVWMFIRAAI